MHLSAMKKKEEDRLKENGMGIKEEEKQKNDGQETGKIRINMRHRNG